MLAAMVAHQLRRPDHVRRPALRQQDPDQPRGRHPHPARRRLHGQRSSLRRVPRQVRRRQGEAGSRGVPDHGPREADLLGGRTGRDHPAGEQPRRPSRADHQPGLVAVGGGGGHHRTADHRRRSVATHRVASDRRPGRTSRRRSRRTATTDCGSRKWTAARSGSWKRRSTRCSARSRPATGCCWTPRITSRPASTSARTSSRGRRSAPRTPIAPSRNFWPT